jgi:adenylate kinase family enzyme
MTFLFVSGQSGAGKTTLGKNLAKEYGFTHFDGDVFFTQEVIQSTMPEPSMATLVRRKIFRPNGK